MLTVLSIRKVDLRVQVTCLGDTVRGWAGSSDLGPCDSGFYHPVSSMKGKVHRKLDSSLTSQCWKTRGNMIKKNQ